MLMRSLPLYIFPRRLKSWLNISYCSASSTLFRVDQYFDFIIVSTENATSHKYIVQNGRSIFRTTSEIVGNSVLILSQNSLSGFI